MSKNESIFESKVDQKRGPKLSKKHQKNIKKGVKNHAVFFLLPSQYITELFLCQFTYVNIYTYIYIYIYTLVPEYTYIHIYIYTYIYILVLDFDIKNLIKKVIKKMIKKVIKKMIKNLMKKMILFFTCIQKSGSRKWLKM